MSELGRCAAAAILDTGERSPTGRCNMVLNIYGRPGEAWTTGGDSGTTGLKSGENGKLFCGCD